MNDAQTLLGNPAAGFFLTLIIGLIAGWIAEKVTSSNHGLFTNLIVGVAGAFVGNKLAEIAQIPVYGFWRGLISASIGAIILIFVWRAITSRRSAM
ncbi:MAG: GlsB/YeaQ/YmgE family stress response membrane protein [Xanthobacteraceae bacterium]|nr:GlsB/YeaQ/YmgE family stress response membrane protein [Xanthobacteraceae bacterium]MBX3533231.1 GlsB/YeaQ/YmgE family stress response membrane protein [Xanthobacteraceae bacterium]MBX3547658.1 GlsB/YeaQ/YmgE family stress response membrane protein [Xanthobacteraceae bacterium]MCW5674872.1 GlsB/YeaQ/YmgE family stress response membrane protein [Xanthobacteraceae bacterium]MCW5677221.1 GlsB/YeaQ/YmgE family stress response membrane protein [Xanthobacteraceae bacterium]